MGFYIPDVSVDMPPSLSHRFQAHPALRISLQQTSLGLARTYVTAPVTVPRSRVTAVNTGYVQAHSAYKYAQKS